MFPFFFSGVHTINISSHLSEPRQRAHAIGQQVLQRNASLPLDQRMRLTLNDKIQVDDQGLQKNRLFVRALAEEEGFLSYSYDPAVHLAPLAEQSQYDAAVQTRIKNGLNPNPYIPIEQPRFSQIA